MRGIAGHMGSKAVISHRSTAAGLLALTLLAGAVIGFSPGPHHAAARATTASASHHTQPISAPPPMPPRSAPTPTRSARAATVGPRRTVRVYHNQPTPGGCEKSAVPVPRTVGCQPAPVATGAFVITDAPARAHWPAGSPRSWDNSRTLPTLQARTQRAAPAPTALINSAPLPPRFYVGDGTSGLAAPANVVGTGATALHPAALPGVALTFDDGPSPLYTPRVLAVLRRYHAPATFFVVGYHALQYPDLVRAEARAGMTVGDHSFDHPNYPPFAALTAEQIDTEIAQGRNALHGLAPPPRLFRPPGGSFSLYVEAAAHRLGLRVTLWSVDPTDWATGVSSEQIVTRVLGAVRPGSIVIMHDGGGNRAATVVALPAIIAGIHAKGLRLVALHD